MKIRHGFGRILLLVLFGLLAAALLTSITTAQAGPLAQIPTVAIPTVTGSPRGPVVTARRDTNQDYVTVRTGPSRDYPAIGVLIAGQQAPALGRNTDGTWVLIAYQGVEGGQGWVYSVLVDLVGTVPFVDAPPTPTPNVTPTLNPTLEAQFVVELPPTRLPTFTPPPPLIIPAFLSEENAPVASGPPMGFVIVGLLVVGFFGTVISLLRGR
jgi:hypothetical protein